MSKHTEELVEDVLEALLEGGESREHAIVSLRAFGAGALQAAIRRLLQLQERNFWCDVEAGEVDPGWTKARLGALSIAVGGMAVESMAERLERQAQELLDLAKELRR